MKEIEDKKKELEEVLVKYLPCDLYNNVKNLEYKTTSGVLMLQYNLT